MGTDGKMDEDAFSSGAEIRLRRPAEKMSTPCPFRSSALLVILLHDRSSFLANLALVSYNWQHARRTERRVRRIRMEPLSAHAPHARRWRVGADRSRHADRNAEQCDGTSSVLACRQSRALRYCSHTILLSPRVVCAAWSDACPDGHRSTHRQAAAQSAATL